MPTLKFLLKTVGYSCVLCFWFCGCKKNQHYGLLGDSSSWQASWVCVLDTFECRGRVSKRSANPWLLISGFGGVMRGATPGILSKAVKYIPEKPSPSLWPRLSNLSLSDLFLQRMGKRRRFPCGLFMSVVRGCGPEGCFNASL